jgi:hypothetical protein
MKKDQKILIKEKRTGLRRKIKRFLIKKNRITKKGKNSI